MVKVTADWKMGDHSVGGLGNCFRGGIALWNGMAGALVMIVCVTAAIWAGTKIIKKAQM